MLRRFWLILDLVLLAAFPAFAQDTAWSAYLYNISSKELVRVNSDGTTHSSYLNLPENAIIGPYDLAFTHDGGKVAFCFTDNDGAMSQNAATLVVHDLAAGKDIVRQNLGAALDCRVGHYGFNSNESMLAVSLVVSFPPEADAPMWLILLIDSATGAVVRGLNSTSLGVAGYPLLTEAPVLPYIQRFTDAELIFVDMPQNPFSANTARNAYRWSLDSDTVEQVDYWDNLELAWLPTTGEIAYATNKESCPAVQIICFATFYNSVAVAAGNGESRIVYQSEDRKVAYPIFINGGRELAIMLHDNRYMDQPNQTLVALDRHGHTRDLIGTFSTLFGVTAAPGGFLALTPHVDLPDDAEMKQGLIVVIGKTQQSVSLVYGMGDQTHELWTSPEGTGQLWGLAWVTPDTPATDLTPFPSVPQ